MLDSFKVSRTFGEWRVSVHIECTKHDAAIMVTRAGRIVHLLEGEEAAREFRALTIPEWFNPETFSRYAGRIAERMANHPALAS